MHCSVKYEGETLAVKTGQYLTRGVDSKLTQLLIATGFAADFDAVTARYEAEGLDTDFLEGKQFRILYTATVGKNGRPWIKETGYAPLPKMSAKNKPQPAAPDDENVPF
jgi:hypothetical protein